MTYISRQRAHMSYKSHTYITYITMHEGKCECMKYHTKRMSPSHMLPLSLTYSLPLPLWHQAPKPKGRIAGQEQTSLALRCDERSKTELHHPRTLNSKQLDPLERTQAYPLSLEVEGKRSWSARWTRQLGRPMETLKLWQQPNPVAQKVSLQEEPQLPLSLSLKPQVQE